MGHSDFYEMYNTIRKQEVKELQLALDAHGGSFIWIDDEHDREQLYSPPCIAVNVDCGPMDIIVHKAWFDDSGIQLLVSDKEWGDKIDIELKDIVPGHLAYLIEYMPITTKVNDVSIKQEFFNTARISRDDLTTCGFDAETLSDKDMKIFADKMGHAYIEDGYWENIKIIAEIMNIPKIEKTEDKQ